MVKIVEAFHSIQGEGTRAGKPSLFIRLFGCNLCCVGFGQPDPSNPSTYHKVEFKKGESPKYGCDSPHSWHKMFADDCMDFETGGDLADYLIQKFDFARLKELVITGGEPMLHQDFILDMLERLKDTSNEFAEFVTIETNGTIEPNENFCKFKYFINKECKLLFSISPKLNCVAGVNEEKSIRLDVLDFITRVVLWDFQLKFVFNGDKRAEDRVEQIINELISRNSSLINQKHKVLLMPVGAHSMDKELLKATAKTCLENGYSYCPRLHVDIWGKETGV